MKGNLKVIFVAGANFSGSTMAGCILGSDRSGDPLINFHVGEAHAFFRSRYGDFSAAVERSSFGRIWKNVDPNDGYESLIPQIARISSKTQTIIDSSKLLGNLRLQHKVCLKFGLPFSVYLSYRPLAKIMASSFKNGKSEQEALTNVEKYESILKYISQHDIKFVVVNTEKLLGDPKSYVSTVCDELGIEYFEGKEKYWDHQHCHLYGNAVQGRQIKGLEDKGFLAVRPDPEIDHLASYPSLKCLDAELSELCL